MRIRRGRLFWGLFLIPLGVIPLLDRAGIVDLGAVPTISQWWPLILIAMGVAILLGRSRVGLVGTVIVALILGTLGGTALASGSFAFGSLADCTSSLGSEASNTTLVGTFSGAASAEVDLDCGSVAVAIAPGTGWRVDADHRGTAPEIQQSDDSLTVRTPASTGSHRQEWTITLGADAIRTLHLEINAASASATLAGAALTEANVDMNAGDLLLDGTGATIDEFSATVNAGRLRITLDGATTGDVSANAGAIDLCVPADANVTFEVDDDITFATNLSGRGLSQNGDTWTRPGPGPSIDLKVDGNAASFTLDPEGGCS
jgi:hypothetical protein